MTVLPRRLAALAALLLGSAAPLASVEAGPRAVIELFTSQGCSSCPAADALLKQLAADPSLLALSFNVDYWDYLGWKDTLATPENTARQRAYAALRGDRSVYTPQIVVNGRRHLVGSDRVALEAALTVEERQLGGLTVPVDLVVAGDTLKVAVGPAPAGSRDLKANVLVVFFDRSREVQIPRGENKGRTIVYTNVVRRLQTVAMWKGEALAIDLPKSELEKMKADGCAVLLQAEANGYPGAILGAAVVPPSGS